MIQRPSRPIPPSSSVLGSGTISKRLVMPAESPGLSVKVRVMPIWVATPGPAAWEAMPLELVAEPPPGSGAERATGGGRVPEAP